MIALETIAISLLGNRDFHHGLLRMGHLPPGYLHESVVDTLILTT
jgi:hypothetical protein